MERITNKNGNLREFIFSFWGKNSSGEMQKSPPPPNLLAVGLRGENREKGNGNG
jgi:hypothetical protein